MAKENTSQPSRQLNEMTLDELLHLTEGLDSEVIEVDTHPSNRLCSLSVPVEMSRGEIAGFLRRNPIFERMSEAELAEFVARMKAVRYKDGDLICREGDPGNEMWILCKGGIRVSKRGQTVVDLEEGAPVGEMSILDGKPRSTDLIALNDPLLLVLTREAYAEVFRANVDAGTRLVMNITAIQQARLRQTTQQAIENAVAAERANAEIRYVKVVQELALSKNSHFSFGNSEIYVSYKGARGVSGDYYDFITFPHRPHELIVILGDSMGHYLRAALCMLIAKTASYMQTKRLPTVENITSAVNDVLCYLFNAEMLMTFVCVAIDRETHLIRYTNAGHQSCPYLYRMRTGEFVPLMAQTLELGVTPEACYSAEELSYEDGDLLVLYSDGITEAPYCPEGATTVDRSQDFGDTRLREVIAQNAHRSPREITEALLSAVKAFCRFYDGCETIGGEEVDGDDVTTIILRLG